MLQASQRVYELLIIAANQAQNTEYSLLKDTFGTTYGECPPGLMLESLGNVAKIQTGLAKGRKADASTTSMPYLRVANVKDGHLNLDEIKEIIVERDKISRYLLKAGDVLMTEGGDLDKLGRGTVWQKEIKDCLHQNHIFAVRPNTNVLDPWYLAAIARSPYGRSFFLRSAKRSSNLASVNKTQVLGFQVPIMTLQRQKIWLERYKSIRTGQANLRSRAIFSSSFIKGFLK